MVELGVGALLAAPGWRGRRWGRSRGAGALRPWCTGLRGAPDEPVPPWSLLVSLRTPTGRPCFMGCDRVGLAAPLQRQGERLPLLAARRSAPGTRSAHSLSVLLYCYTTNWVKTWWALMG